MKGVTFFVELMCAKCEIESTYIIHDTEEAIDVIIENDWIIAYDDEGNIEAVFCSSSCQDAYIKGDDVFDLEDDDEYDEYDEDSDDEDEITAYGMHIEKIK